MSSISGHNLGLAGHKHPLHNIIGDCSQQTFPLAHQSQIGCRSPHYEIKTKLNGIGLWVERKNVPELSV